MNAQIIKSPKPITHMWIETRVYVYIISQWPPSRKNHQNKLIFLDLTIGHKTHNLDFNVQVEAF